MENCLVSFHHSDILLDDFNGMLTYFAHCYGGIAMREGSRENEKGSRRG